MLRATLDVNVLVSSTIGPLGPSRHAFEAWQVERFTLITSEHIIQHASAKLRLPRIARRYHIYAADVDGLELLLRTAAESISILPEDVIPVTGDPEDDAVLATVRLGQTTFLVTGDHGLLDLGAYAGARIVSPRTFLALLDE
jgi:putative PIN family toxin of toxin-antitoxin system